MKSFREFFEIASNAGFPTDYDAFYGDEGGDDGGIHRNWKHLDIPTVSKLGPEFRDVNHIKSFLAQEAKKRGGIARTINVWSFDGAFFRQSFSTTVPANMDGLVGKIMEYWTVHGGNPYECKAVFISEPGSKTLKVVRLDGQDVSRRNWTTEHDSFNDNPSNDNRFMRQVLPKFLEGLK